MPIHDELPLLVPDLQIAFYYRLQELRERYLHEALANAVRQIDVPMLDDELAEYAQSTALNRVAGYGLRGELIFPVPCLLRVSPSLLGYYRLLFGLSQKEFYFKGRYGKFKALEERNCIPSSILEEIPALCHSLN